jgi:alpha-D-ribose 1-methylphosphonate 5-triphosphate synthase subunit PhnL
LAGRYLEKKTNFVSNFKKIKKMAKFSTLHIFGFGDVQVVAQPEGATKKASELTALQAVIDNVWAQKPADNTGTKEYHAINIFDGMFADWQPKVQGEKGFRVQIGSLDMTLVQALVDEVMLVVAEPVV